MKINEYEIITTVSFAYFKKSYHFTDRRDEPLSKSEHTGYLTTDWQAKMRWYAMGVHVTLKICE